MQHSHTAEACLKLGSKQYFYLVQHGRVAEYGSYTNELSLQVQTKQQLMTSTFVTLYLLHASGAHKRVLKAFDRPSGTVCASNNVHPTHLELGSHELVKAPAIGSEITAGLVPPADRSTVAHPVQFIKRGGQSAHGRGV